MSPTKAQLLNRLSKLETGGIDLTAEILNFKDHLRVMDDVLLRVLDRGKKTDDTLMAEATQMQKQFGTYSKYQQHIVERPMPPAVRKMLDEHYPQKGEKR
ncbi:hypothetical protein [Desulfopila aestuarii]|uniref:Uncharacterized protein n=1 Tax=Desulfopila aestuarii DSM 18488 TaxID=1121416 RepID=A0A1M7YFI5_9BACT|nr:hypothetical protein [Desulfopila aestuarii]SHO51405.1 hypothetical protein SAMN02745220_03989 [Desulfopila aestuarii DSM 18488]